MRKLAANRTPEHREKLAEVLRQVRRRKGPTRLEQTLYRILAEQSIPFRREVRFGRYVVDAYDDHTKTAYEADGEYWHDAARDAARDAELFRRYGVSVVRFSEAQLKAYPTDER